MEDFAARSKDDRGGLLLHCRLNARLPPLAPLQASPARKSAEQIRQELREQARNLLHELFAWLLSMTCFIVSA